MNSERARIVFAGTPAFAVPTLKQLAESNFRLVGVLTQPDRPAGRGRRVQMSPVKEVAVELGLPVLQPKTLRTSEAQSWLESRRPAVMVVVAYGLILSEKILQLPAQGCVNVHASLLPRWRGASPIQAALLNGDSRTGISIMRMEAGLDTGPVYAQRELRIGPNETAGKLHDRLAELGAECLWETLPGILDASITPEPQDDAIASYAPRIDKADAKIDWTASAQQIHNLIRAYNPWPVAETRLDGRPLRCWASSLTSSVSPVAELAPGTVVAETDDALRVQTGDGLLDLTELQLPNRQRMSADKLARGYNGPLSGKRLGR